MGNPGTDASFLGQLLAAYRYGATGVIAVRADKLTTFVYVSKGTPVFAEEGTLGETLGRVMLRQGTIDQDQYAKIIERMTDSVFGSEQLRFGEVAVALGYLTLDQVNAALAEQVRQKILHCMQWESATSELVPNADALEEVAHYPCRLEPLVLEGFRRHYDVERLGPLWRAAAHFYVAPTDGAGVMAARYAVTPEERESLAAMDGSRTAEELAGGGVDAMRLVAALIATQGATLHASKAEGQEAARACARVRVAAPRAAVPAAPAPPPKQPEVAVVQPVAVRSPSARPSIPPPPSLKHARLQAEQAFQKGKRSLRAGLVGKAVEELGKAAKLHPDAAEYQLYAAWARFRATQAPTALQGQRAELARLALAAVREDRNMAFAHYVHGQLALMDGDEKTALKSFRVAWKLDPENVDALRHLRVLGRRGEG